MSFTRQTVSNPVSFQGLGLHTGVPVRMTIHPGKDGIRFRLGSDRFLASPENVTDTTRSTRLGTIGTVEHLMSAFAGLELTDAEVELDAPEVPGMDGSSTQFVEGIQQVGFESLGENPMLHLYRRVFYHEGSIKVAVAKGNGHWRYVYEAGSRWPGTQSYEAQSVVDAYPDQIAKARTFALSEEIPMIMKMGLGKGLDETSALILGLDGYENEERFSDEPARHKLLDSIGDLYLAGIPIGLLNVVSERSGHAANVKAAAMLKAATQP